MTMRIVLTFTCVLVLASPTIGDETPSSNDTGQGENGNQWDSFDTYHERDKPQPEAHVLKTLQVKWQKLQIDPLSNYCTVKGQLVVPSTGDQSERPADWLQGVTVYVAKVPGQRHGWLHSVDSNTALHQICVLDLKGGFEAKFKWRETERDRTQTQSFQFGIALANNRPNGDYTRIDWKSSDPVLPSSIEMFEVPAAPKYSDEIELVNRAAFWPFEDPDSTHLIRAVNALQRIGKTRAIEELERYNDLFFEGQGHSMNRETFWIVRLLFEPIEPGDVVPYPGIYIFPIAPNSNARLMWPLDPIELYADIPFLAGNQSGGGSGVPELPNSCLAWARRHAVIRDEPLHPTMNPIAAVEEIANSARFLKVREFSKEDSSFRKNAYAMIKHLVIDEVGADFVPELDDNWKKLVEVVNKKKIQWDVEREEFVITPEKR